MTNRRAIYLNNTAVDSFESGNVVHAFQILTKALSLTSNFDSFHCTPEKRIYRYFWVECASAYNKRIPRDEKEQLCLNEGISSFLCLRALKVSIDPSNVPLLDRLDSSGYAWVICYNLALVSNLMGTRLGEKGYGLLAKAFELLQSVQDRINAEPFSQDWPFLQMAVINNQACIYRELAMMDALYDSLGKMERTLSNNSDTIVGKKHRDAFYFNFVILSGQTFAPAA